MIEKRDNIKNADDKEISEGEKKAAHALMGAIEELTPEERNALLAQLLINSPVKYLV